ncbi:hypothetical protein WICMUC_002124 [Wickerhamomyces mucosus]|uniref:Major facilitator superfamily (MFS) profile domain-containing protein n=1 Tax=Wickerhamomyces mucosus TaxID=1378264 RepID=A0A9P8PQ71_9ASCO|nr:hypothetical protein WICMUC_002124 [Wickerhamomyces mucosus]
MSSDSINKDQLPVDIEVDVEKNKTLDFSPEDEELINKYNIPEDLLSELTTSDFEFLKIETKPQRIWEWFSKTDTKAEKKLMIKLDLLILLYLVLNAFVKTLDSSAVSYAYASGMQDALKMYGNQLTYQSSCYMAGFIFGQIPLTLLATRLPLNIFLPVMDSIWGIFTLVLFKITSYRQLYIIRFFSGLVSSFMFPAANYILGSWYTKNNLTLRSAIYFCASELGGMISGYIQAAAYKNLDGLHGIAGWQWLYILAFIITIPIAVYGYWTLPGYPDQCKSKFLTNDEIRLARLRMIKEGRTSNEPFTLQNLTNALKGWRFWMLVIFAIFFSQADGISSYNGLLLWLEKNNYSNFQINTITTVIPAVTIFFSLVNAIINDYFHESHPWIIGYVAVLNLLASILLTIWNISKGGIMFAFFLSGTADSIAAILYSWANIICSGNSQERALTLSTMNTLGNTFSVWVPIFVWKTLDAPRYLKGYAYNIALDAMMLILLYPLTYLYKRDKTNLKNLENIHITYSNVAV